MKTANSSFPFCRGGLRTAMQAGLLFSFRPLATIHNPQFKIQNLPSPSTFFAALLLCLLPAALLADTHTWTGGAGGGNYLATTPANWGGTAPETNDDIALAATSSSNMTWNMTNMTVASWTQSGYLGTVTVATVYGTTGFTNLNITGNCIISNGVWTHSANSGGETNRLRVTIGGSLTVGTGAVIDVTGKGYAAAKGPGFGNGANSSGSHGGRGGLNIPNLPGPCYGSIVAPTNLGSGGSANSGGGAVLLNVAGNVLCDGAIRASGAPGDGNPAAASGGSIFITAGSLSGGGGIIAKASTNVWIAGGGGRIALVVTNALADFSNFTGSLFACTEICRSGTAGTKGFAGTIYREKPGDIPGKGELIVNNIGGMSINAAGTDLSGVEAVTCEFSRITLTNGASLNIDSNDTLIVTNTTFMCGAANGIWISGGTLRAPTAFVFSNMFIGISVTGSTFNPSTSLTIGTNAEFRVDVPYVMTNDMIITAGGNLTHTANGGTEMYKLNLAVVGSLNVQTGGSVNVTGKGYAAGTGLGAAGSYGGHGWGGKCYGSIVTPTNLGSGADDAGGGAIRLTVSGGVTNNGLICADGGSAGNSGAGGSIFLTAGSLAGAGTIRTRGINSGTYASGGGRISLAVTNAGADFSLYTGSILASIGSTYAGAGTVYLRTAAQGPTQGTLIVDNAGVASTDFTEINSNVTDTVVGNIFLRNGAYLLLYTNQSLTLSGIWSNTATLSMQSSAALIFEGDATSIVYGSTTFMGLICTNGLGKTILFQAGKTNTVPAQGRLTLKGSATTTNLVLRSTIDGTPWKLNVNALADQSVINVDVTNSDAMLGVGAPVIAMNSFGRGTNPNWVFVTAVLGETNIWTGASNTAWSLSANWNLARSPVDDDFILIPAGCPRYPALDNSRIVNGIAIQPGASLSLNNYNLLVKKNATLAGSLTASGTETITFQTNADFTGGAFASALSTVILAGNGNQYVDPASLAFYRIAVLNSAGTVAFGNGFSATELRCEAPGGARHITFQQGAAVSLRDFVMMGDTAGTNIFLRSSSVGSRWNLAAVGYRFVQGVDVQDGDARPGLPIPAAFSKDGGNNTNWLFNADATRSVWLGTSGTNFHTAANWAPSGVPGAAARVLVESPNPMAITGAVTLLDLTVGGNTGAASVTAYAPLAVLEDIAILTNGTLALNRPCTISNELCVHNGGLLTHSGNGATDVNKLNVTVYGNVSVELGGVVNVTGKGYATGNGPGYQGSYGGHGWGGQCYGSIVAPTNLGSGGSAAPGGGAICLTVSGEIRHDGLMYADTVLSGTGYGAGGSVFLTAGTMSGVGLIRANGDGGSPYGGGGGRLSLVVTNAGANFSRYTGTMLATGSGKGGAGTIYRQTGAQGSGQGVALIDNPGAGYTDVPPFPPGNVTNEVEFTAFYITNAAILKLTNNFMLGDIFLQSANARLDLGSNTLTVRSRTHALGLGAVTNYGAIIWWPDIPRGVVFSTW